MDLPPVPCFGREWTGQPCFWIPARWLVGAETHVATGEVTALKHEGRDHAMELGTAVAKALLASAKGTEVFSGLGGDILVEVEIDPANLVCDGQLATILKR